MAWPLVDLEGVLACPQCGGRLSVKSHNISCIPCAATFPVVDGIPVLIPRNTQEVEARSSQPFESIADQYDETIPKHVVEHYQSRRLSVVRRVIEGGAVLDVCCGTGMLTSALLSRGYSPVGVDASLSMLRVFRRRQPDAVAINGYAQRLPFRDGSFDMVLCVAALHHIAEPGLVARSLGEMYRVVREGGTVLVWDHNPNNPYWPLIMARVPQDSGEERLVPLAEIERCFRAVGCQNVESLRLGFTPDFLPRHTLGLWRWLERLAEAVPFVRNVAAHNVILARKG